MTQGREKAAAVFSGPRTIRIERAPLPEPGPEQVRVRLEGCGVCGSNLPVWQGRVWFEYPLAPGAPGHEGWGIVDAIGEGVGTIAPGMRVAALSYHAYAECDVAEAANVVELPKELDGMPFPGEPLGCAMNVIRRAAIRTGETVRRRRCRLPGGAAGAPGHRSRGARDRAGPAHLRAGHWPRDWAPPRRSGWIITAASSNACAP